MENLENAESLDLENQIIQTEDEEGNLHNFELIDIIEVDEQEYGILLYVEDENSQEDEEEQELAIMRLVKEGEGYIFETIEDEAEFEKVSAFVEAELNAELDEEDEE
jgi:uncharacterized protein YrzB (UPF0473 family)